MRIDEIAGLPEKCTGCFACYQVCPVHAIEKKQQNDGFFYPTINKDICTSCGLCAKACSINKEKEKTITPHIYSVQAIDEDVRFRASSGGVFELLSKKIMDNGGVVFGAAFDSETKTVRHISTDKTELTYILRSKYVQSDTAHSFSEVANALKNGRAVLYCGTPCQITGLKNYLDIRHITGNLITTDFMCHGVPSPGFFKDYLCSMEKEFRSELVDITFREKDLGWRTQVQKLYFKNGKICMFESGKHYYYYYFLNNYTLRDSCFTCKEYNSHIADITLADHWLKQGDDNKGTSLVFCNTEQGKKVFDDIREQCDVDFVADDVNYELYSHAKYNYESKKQWKLQCEKVGFKGISGVYFRKVYNKQKRKRFVRFIGGTVKRKIKQLLKK